MPLVRISHAARYDQSVNEAVMRDVTQAYAAATGCDPAKVWVLIEEVEKTMWASGGNSLAANAVPAK